MDPLTIASVAAPIIGGIFGKQGQASANASNAAEAALNRKFQAGETKLQRDFSADQAQINRAFQERLSSTAYQRSMADMKKSGLNPMLAYMKGGASTPGGATGTSSAASGSQAQYKNELEAAANSASQFAINLANVQNIKANTAKTKIDAAVNATQLPKKKIGEDLWDIIQKDIEKLTGSAREFQESQKSWWNNFSVSDTLDKWDKQLESAIFGNKKKSNVQVYKLGDKPSKGKFNVTNSSKKHKGNSKKRYNNWIETDYTHP